MTITFTPIADDAVGIEYVDPLRQLERLAAEYRLTHPHAPSKNLIDAIRAEGHAAVTAAIAPWLAEQAELKAQREARRAEQDAAWMKLD
jgi:hypothetical protein